MTTPLPPSTDFTAGTVTEGGFKTAISAMRQFLADLLGTTGATADARVALGTPLNASTAKTANYTVVAADAGKMIDCTSGTFTLTLTAAVTLGDGFAFAVRNSGSGVITIDPNGAEQIDGAATITLAAGETAFVMCIGGTAFKTVSRVVNAVQPFATNQVVYYQNLATVTSGRVTGTVYTNNSGRTRFVSLAYISFSGTVYVDNVNGATTAVNLLQSGGGAPWNSYSFMVPPGWKYQVTGTSSASNFYGWTEWD